MTISPGEAEEALADIQKITRKTRRSLANSGLYIFLIITGLIWTVGFLANQFLSGRIVVYIWVGMSILGSIVSILLGRCMDRRVRASSTSFYLKRIAVFWLLLVLFCLAVIAVVRPADGKELTMLIILFILIGQMTTGVLFSFSSVGWLLPVTALALAGYFLMPAYFYLWMSILVGGSMITIGLYIRWRW